MSDIQYVVGEVTSASVDALSQVLVRLPGTDIFRATDTYANQASPGNQILMALGDTNKLAAAIMSDVRSNSTIEGKLLKVQSDLDGLGEEIERFKEYNYQRAKLLLPYAQEGGLREYEIERKIENELELTYKEIDTLVSSVPAMKRIARARSPIKEAVVRYIQNGEADDQTLYWLASNIDPIYEKVMEYNDLVEHKQKLDPVLPNLEQALIQSIDAIKTGEDYQEEIEFDDTKINVRERLKQLIGAEPGRYIPFTIDEVIEGENKDSFIVPLQYRGVKGGSIPEELMPHYMSVARLGHIITLLERALANILVTYSRLNPEISEISKDYLLKGLAVKDGVLVRAMFQEHFEPILTLYSDVRLKITKDEQAKKIMDIIRNERATIPSVVAEHFGIPEEQIKLEEMVSLLTQIMPILPMLAYTSSEAYVRLVEINNLNRRERLQRKTEEVVLRGKFTTTGRQLQRDFGVNQESIGNRSEATNEETIELFGEKYRFLSEILIKNKDESE